MKKQTIPAILTMVATFGPLVATASAASLDLGDYSITVQQGAAWPAGTDFGLGPSQSSDLAGPFNGQSAYYRGWDAGGPAETLDGAYLVHRTRIDFNNLVELDAITFSAGGHHEGQAQARLLDAAFNEIASVPLTGFNTLGSFSILDANALGSTFYLEEYDYSTTWRLRDDYVLNYTVQPVPDTGSVLPLLAATAVAITALHRRWRVLSLRNSVTT